MAFFEVGGHWLWPIAGDYDVMALDPDYRWSLVGHPSRDYAWILAREPQLDDAHAAAAARPAGGRAATIPAGSIVTAEDDPRRGQSLCALP